MLGHIFNFKEKRESRFKNESNKDIVETVISVIVPLALNLYAKNKIYEFSLELYSLFKGV